VESAIVDGPSLSEKRRRKKYVKKTRTIKNLSIKEMFFYGVLTIGFSKSLYKWEKSNPAELGFTAFTPMEMRPKTA
jgi:hypothetical protein